MFDLILNTPLMKEVRTQIVFAFFTWVIASRWKCSCTYYEVYNDYSTWKIELQIYCSSCIYHDRWQVVFMNNSFPSDCKHYFYCDHVTNIVTIVYKKVDERLHRVTTNDNEWQQVTTSGTTSGTASDNEWQRVTKTDNKWQRMTASHKTNKFERK